MRDFSFYPPTTELDVANKLNKDIKEVKSLKKNGILDYKGRLICNLSLDEYINGGCGYNETLSLKIQRKIDDKIKEYHQSILLRDKASSQLLKLSIKSLIKITYKGGEMMKPTNPYAIKKVMWSKKVDKLCNEAIQKLESKLIVMLAYNYYTPSLYDNRCLYIKNEYLKQIRELGLVAKITSLIDKKVENLILINDEVEDRYSQLEEKSQKLIKTIQTLKKDISSYGNFDNPPKSMLNRLKEDKNKLSELEDKEEYDEYFELADDLFIEYEILLWRRFKAELNKHNPYGYNDFVTEFNQRDDTVNNRFLSQSDVLNIVNETKRLYGENETKSFKSALNELKQLTDWNYDL